MTSRDPHAPPHSPAAGDASRRSAKSWPLSRKTRAGLLYLHLRLAAAGLADTPMVFGGHCRVVGQLGVRHSAGRRGGRGRAAVRVALARRVRHGRRGRRPDHLLAAGGGRAAGAARGRAARRAGWHGCEPWTRAYRAAWTRDVLPSCHHRRSPSENRPAAGRGRPRRSVAAEPDHPGPPAADRPGHAAAVRTRHDQVGLRPQLVAGAPADRRPARIRFRLPARRPARHRHPSPARAGAAGLRRRQRHRARPGHPGRARPRRGQPDRPAGPGRRPRG